ncbi:MAG: hypothetical protein Q8M54_00455 [Desulfobaccales bacterium]|nr:hypothetical protein [Desulfobaccales bacterium]
MRNEAIKSIMAANNLPQNIAEQIVGQDGIVDQGKLSVALSGVSWGKNPASSATPGLVQALVDALKDAMARRDMGAVMNLRSRLNKMGIANPE